jgi:hypothetical protein
MKQIWKITVCSVAVLIFANFAQAQKVNLVGTTWTVFTRIEKNERWTKYGTVTFLKGGKLKVDDNACGGNWTLKGNKVSFQLDCSDRAEMEAAIKGNSATGGGLIGMGRRGEVWVRMVKK